MTAVLSPTDAFRHNMLSVTPNDDSYNTDWRQKYIELSETLAETRADLEEFQQSSKELEEEMTLEIERTERAQQEQKAKTVRVEAERDEWKSKFMVLQTTHNTATTSLQRELDKLRQQEQMYKVQMRELEIGNDDLERNERAVMSSLADVESKYSKVLEEKILLEHELLDKANLEEKSQRLQDELRDANEEISSLKRQLEQARSAPSLPSTLDITNDRSPFPVSPRRSLDEELLRTSAPTELLLSDLTPIPAKRSVSRPSPTPPLTPVGSSRDSSSKSRSAMDKPADPPAGFSPAPAASLHLPASFPSSLPRSSTIPSLSPARTTNHTALGQNFTRPSTRAATSNLAVLPGTASKSKGVQMISALRSRVQTTQQRLIPGIPRLRMGSVSGRSGPTPQPMSNGSGTTQVSLTRPDSIDEGRKRSSVEKQRDATDDSRTGAQSPGWVLIQTQDDSPMPIERKDPTKDRRRLSSPSPTTGGHAPIPSAFKPLASVSTTRNGPPGGLPRRPHSRLSDGSTHPMGVSLFASSSIPTPSSRPSTPTFLPVPSFTHHGSKRSTEAASASFATSSYNPRRSSLGMHPPNRSVSPSPQQTAIPTSSYTILVSTHERPTSVPATSRASFGSSQAVQSKNTALGKSRIGKPVAGKPTPSGSSENIPAISRAEQQGRLRSGSTSNI